MFALIRRKITKNKWYTQVLMKYFWQYADFLFCQLMIFSLSPEQAVWKKIDYDKQNKIIPRPFDEDSAKVLHYPESGKDLQQDPQVLVHEKSGFPLLTKLWR